jgi:hypothetical protein
MYAVIDMAVERPGQKEMGTLHVESTDDGKYARLIIEHKHVIVNTHELVRALKMAQGSDMNRVWEVKP